MIVKAIKVVLKKNASTQWVKLTLRIGLLDTLIDAYDDPDAFERAVTAELLHTWLTHRP